MDHFHRACKGHSPLGLAAAQGTESQGHYRPDPFSARLQAVRHRLPHKSVRLLGVMGWEGLGEGILYQ